MPEDVLDAIKKALEGKAELKGMKGPPARTVFMNPSRQKIYAYLCRHPCAYPKKISDQLGMSIPTVNWHLKVLKEKSFLSSAKYGKREVFYPTALLKAQWCPLFAVLQGTEERTVFLHVIREPGISSSELASASGIKRGRLARALSGLRRAGAVAVTQDGRQNRYYVSRSIPKLKSAMKKQAVAFRHHVLSSLRKDGVLSRLLLAKDDELHIEVFQGAKRATLVLSTEPLLASLTER